MPRLKGTYVRPAPPLPVPKLGREDATRLVEFLGDPVAFARGAFGHSHWGIQRRILRSVRDNPWTSVRACHASGKTFTAADAALWWVTRYRDGIVVTTAPTWTQVKKLLWGEIQGSLAQAKEVGRLAYPEANEVELKLGPKNYAMGLSTNEGVRFQGWHGRILIVMDEAPGVRADIIDAIEGIRAGGQVHVLELGNPIIPSGPFYDSHTKLRAHRAAFRISAFDVPNLIDCCIDDAANGVFLGNPGGANLLTMGPEDLGDDVRPYLTQRRWVLEKYLQWGPDNPLFQAKVLGDFPDQDEFSLVALAWIEAAVEERLVDPATDLRTYAGVDVAGPGKDNTVLTLRRGPNVIFGPKRYPMADARGPVAKDLAPFKAELSGERGGALNIDEIGIGYHFMTHFRDLGFNVRGVNVAETARNSERFANVKAELYWGLRERFKAGDVGNLRDEEAQGQLAGLRWFANARGQIEMESKKDMAKKRGLPSPDSAESVMLAFAPPRALDSTDANDYAGVRR